MRLAEFGDNVVIEGVYDLNAQMDGFKVIQETFKLKLTFPATYPKDLPTVTEISNSIPRYSDYHTYSDGSFCLGSDVKLKSILFEAPAITDFADKILDPFLYAVSYKYKYGVYPFGELDHGEAGLIDDYEQLFSVNGKNSVLLALVALGKRKREANKLLCPCGCGFRLGRCEYRFRLARWRKIARRRWFRGHLSKFSPVERPKKTKKSKSKRK